MSVQVRLAGPGDRPALHALRHEVFVVGQDVPVEIERDELDADADHVVAVQDGSVVGTGRLVCRADGTGSVGRMAVAGAVRSRGVGGAVLRRLEDRALERGLTAIELHAQVHARRFYERAGYTPFGDVYLEAGIEHLGMRKPLPAGVAGVAGVGDRTVREVRDDDGEALVALIGGCWTEYPGVELHVDEEEPWLRAPASAYRSWGGRMWVVEIDADFVACCGLKPLGDGPTVRAVELKSMYVAARARRRGLARLLEALVRADAARRGARRVELWSDTRFTAAHATYEALGYERLSGERDLHDLSHSREYPFAKQLDP